MIFPLLLYMLDANYVYQIRWAAYVAGTILVLMKELGVRFEDSISMLVRGYFFVVYAVAE